MGIFDFLRRKQKSDRKFDKTKKIERKTDETPVVDEVKPIQIVGKTTAENDLPLSASKIKFSTFDWKKEIILEPILTEKINQVKLKNYVAFKVNPRANKSEIKKAVERIFNVKVEKVRTENFAKRLRGRLKIRSKRPKFKKAYIKLAGGSKISLFE